MKIQILGTGCPKCKLLAANAEAAVRESGVAAEIVKVTDINEITDFGVMLTPAIAIDGEVRSVGKVLSAGEIKEILKA